MKQLKTLFGVEQIRSRLAASPSERILPRYQRSSRDALAAALLISVIILYAFVSGYFIGVFQQYILQQFLAPLLIFVALILWALPDKQVVNNRAFVRSFYAFVIVSIIWPNYLAIALPGLPWITLSRLALFTMILLFLTLVSIDTGTRTQIASVFRRYPPMLILLIMFTATQFISIPFRNPPAAFSSVIDAIALWTLPFLSALIIFQRPGRFETLIKIVIACAAVLCLIALREYQLGRVPWAGHVPSFLRSNNPLAEGVMGGARRAADGLYRIQTTFTTSLSCAEFMAMVLPFVIHYILHSKAQARLFLIVLYVAVVTVIVVTRSRLGMIGFGITHLTYPLLLGLRRRATIKNDLVGPSLIALYPAMLISFMGLILASRRLYVMFLGGGQHQASNNAREAMYQKGIPMIFQHPLGFGAGQGGPALGYISPSGTLTIDSYYLSIGLDHGVFGFIAFYGMLLFTIYVAVRVYLTSSEPEARLAGPVAISLGTYFVVKSVLSQSQNQYLMFILMAAALVLGYRYTQPGSRSFPSAKPQ